MKYLLDEWNIFKFYLNILISNKSLIFFTIISWIVTTSFFITTSVIMFNLIENLYSMSFLDYIYLFIVFFITYFIVNFFNSIIIYICIKIFLKESFKKRDAIKNSVFLIKKLFLWYLFSSTFGLIIKIIESFSKINYHFNKNFLKTMNYLIGNSWNIIYLFVSPIMVDKKQNGIYSIKKSVNLINKKWGKNLKQNYYVEIIEFFIKILFIALIFLIIFILFLFFGSNILLISLIILKLLIFLLIIVFSTINHILKTSLYLYAEKNIYTKNQKKYLNNYFKKLF